MRIGIASGKGGTGKTTFATSLAVVLAHHGENVTYLDCDVEAPNGHILMQPAIRQRTPFSIPSPQVDERVCAEHTSCAGACGKACRRSAITVLEGSVRQEAGRTLFESKKGTQLPLETDKRGACSVMFRPQNIEVRKPGGAQQPNRCLIPGRVLNMEFLGSIVRYEVAIGEDRVLVDHSHQQFEPPFERGAEVEVALVTDHLVTLD